VKIVTIIILVLCGLALASYSIASAFLNGMRMAPAPTGYIVGAVLSAFFVWATLSGSLAMRALKLRSFGFAFTMACHWLFFTALALTMSIGFAAGFRGDTVSVRQAAIDAHDRAKVRRELVMADLKTAQAAHRRTERLQSELKTLDGQLSVDPPAVADYQAASISWLTGASSGTVAQMLPVAMAVAGDIGPAGCFMALTWLSIQAKPTVLIKKRRRRKRRSNVVKLAQFRQRLK
jgi:hypothetical protein